MAIIKDVAFDAVLTDINSVMLNAFTTSGDTWYFAYVNTSGHGVLYSSGDAGVSWSLSADYGQADYVSVTTAKDGDVVVTVSSSLFAQTAVYKAGSQVVVARLADQGAVTFWPMTFYLGVPVTGFGTFGDASAGSLESPNAAAIMPVVAVLGYGANEGEYNTASYTNFDIGSGFSGIAAVTVGDIHVAQSDPADPHSPLVLKYSTVVSNSWVGLVSTTYSGFLSFGNYAGASTGGGGNNLVYSVANSRGTFFDGYPSGTIAVADRGLTGSHRTAFSCLIDGTVACFFVDHNGLFGSTIDDGVLQSVDSSGTLSPFNRAKIYGNTGDTWGSLSFGPADQSGSLTVLTVTANSGETAHALYRLHDPDPVTRTHAKNTQLLSKLTTVSTLGGQVVDPFDITTSSNALGPARVTGTAPKYGVDLLIQACVEDGVVPNPNHSPGCSPVLRELMAQSGVPYSVVRELANDGDPNGHQGGNALDLAGPSTSTVLTGASVTDAASQEMAEIVAFLRAVPSLFASVIHYDPVTPSHSLFIWDGQITTAAQFGGVNAQIVKDSTSNIHVSSSKSRLLTSLKSPVVQAALGTGPAITDPATGSVTAQTVPDLFNSDKYVYVNDDGYVGSPTTGLAVKKEPAQIINFW